MCQPTGSQRALGSGGCSCGCCGCGCGGNFRRRFLSSQEEKEMLEEYKEALKKELCGVEEELKKLY